MSPFRVAYELWRRLPRRRTAMVVVLLIAAAVLDGVGVGLVLPFLSLLTGSPAEGDVHQVVRVTTVIFRSLGIPQTLGPTLALIGAAMLLRAAVTFVGLNIANRMLAEFLASLRSKLFANLFRVSSAYYAQTTAGALSQCILDDVEKAGQALTFTLKLVSSGGLAVVWTVLLAVLSWQLTVLSLLLAGCLTLLVRVRVTYAQRTGERVATGKQRLSTLTLELLAGMKLVRLTASEGREIEHVRQAAGEVADATYRVSRNTGLVNMIGEGFAAVAILGILYLSVTGLRVDIASLVAFLFVLSRLLPMFHRLNVVRTELQSYLGQAANVVQLLSETDKPYLQDGSIAAPPLRHAVEFRNVWFEYRPGQPVIRDLALEIRQGETIAIAGASGAGKSTIVDLLARFYDPTRGEILLDGIPLPMLQLAGWRRRLAVVTQDVFLFNDTIRNNIAYGTIGLSEREIEEAARLAHAHHFIMALPQGYDTVTGDRGLTLSGGERQRIALARAIARRPELLLLDEATSGLDAESERLIFDAIARLAGQMTIVVIGHRLAALRDADHIYVLEAGCVVESGTHTELLAAGGRYAKYCDLQRL